MNASFVGKARPQRASYRNLARGESTIIFKNVPAEVCTNCGEYYLPNLSPTSC